MKAKFAIFVVGMLLMGSSSIAGINDVGNEKTNANGITINCAFSDPSFVENGDFLCIETAGAEEMLSVPGNPSLPYKSETLAFPFGTKIEGIDVELGNIQTMHLDKKIAPAPEPVPLNGAEPKAAKEGRVYESNEPYPSNWFTYNIGAGIQNGEHAIFLS
ncbi:MAG: hypothetical protein U9O96_06060, partial [Candidatus Thermoplasmatota archaeon]|nr:hypothetical protein [Candidatus Thermoplasmatota archaeon]